MTAKSCYITLSIVILCISSGFSQNIPIYTQFISNPYIYNPAYAGLEGRSTFTLTHRRQWVGINDAPVTSNFVYHTSLNGGVNLGANITQDEAGIFKSTSGLVTFGYTVGIGYSQMISFGISGGAAFNNIDLSSGVNINDPALAGVLDNNTSLAGNAGIGYRVGDLNLGFTLPLLFKTATYGTESFDKGEFDALSNYIVTANYMIYFGFDDNTIDPYVLYRSYQGYTPQFEAGVIVQLKNLFWFGGAYRENFGYAGMVGLKVKENMAIGYAYEIPSNRVSGVNAATHEIQISVSIGERKERNKKFATFLASQWVEREKRPKKEKKEKKKSESTPRLNIPKYEKHKEPDKEPDVIKDGETEDIIYYTQGDITLHQNIRK